MSKGDKALTNSELELTQRIQMFWPRGEVSSEILKDWNGAKAELITERIREAFGRGPKLEQTEPESIPVQPEPLLTSVATATIPALPEFDAKAFFTSGIFHWKQSKVKFWDFGENFKKKFFNMKCGPTQELKIQSSKLNRRSIDSPIIKALGNDTTRIKLTISQFAWLLEQQPNGEEGFLLINGFANIFYIEDEDGTLWAVYGYWLAGIGWRSNAYGFDHPLGWVGGRAVVSQFQDSLNPETSVS